MLQKCPGQDKRNRKVETVCCSSCGYQVEIFSDELKRCCPQCRGVVQRPQLPSCAQWCASARDCIGPERWQQLNQGGG